MGLSLHDYATAFFGYLDFPGPLVVSILFKLNENGLFFGISNWLNSQTEGG